MNYENQKIVNVEINKEVRKSYIDYAMSVIVGRALPDVRDGLKPVHRRILYTMYEDNLMPDKAYRKSATTVGDVLGRYHPHGDAAVYDALVRMAQDFSLRYPLVDGHGNFGSVDGDTAAAYRYTEARMSKIAVEMLTDIEKETVDFTGNYDDRLKEPTVLPSRFPSLMVNGSSGIAVGMATNIPSHNLGEVVDAINHLIDNPDCEIEDLMEHVKGPDFPTAGIIMGRMGIRDAFTKGRGKIIVRARTDIEEIREGRMRIVVTEIPYQVNKARLIENIATLVKDKRIEGISDLRDESDREGMRIAIDLKRDANPQVVLNQLFKYTQMQDTFAVNMLALVNNEPKTLNLKQMLRHYVDFQEEVIVRRTRYDLRKAQERAHILEGLRIALDNIDEVIHIIRTSYNNAKARLMERFGFSDVQAQAILDMRLARLQGLEREKIDAEYAELMEKIRYFNEILANEHLVLEIIKTELGAIRDRFGDKRRTELQPFADEIDLEDLIEEEDCIVTLTHFGYVKRLPVNTYRAQRRGGRGIAAMTTREEDYVEELFVASTHSYILFFTTKGRVYRIKCYMIPEAGRTAKGTNVINLIEMSSDEKVTAVIKVDGFEEEEKCLTMLTRQGVIKRTPLTEYRNARKAGLIALNLDEGDVLTEVRLTDGSGELIIGSREGKAIRFSEEDVRIMGRAARGVRAIDLSPEDYVVGMASVRDTGRLLTVTENGFGKKTELSEYKTQYRGGKGITNYNITEKTGNVAGIKIVDDDEDIMLISSDGTIIRISAGEIPVYSRATQGVRVMRISEDVRVVNLTRTAREEEEEAEALEGEAAPQTGDTAEPSANPDENTGNSEKE